MRRRLVRREASATLWGSCLLFLGTLACGDDQASPLACGDGTERSGDECLPVDAGPAYGGGKDSGAVDAGSSDAQPAASCGEGTIKVDGKCVVNPATVLACGDGTEPVDGKCEVSPPPPVALENMVISQLSLRNRGQLLTDGGKLHQFYPVEVSVGITYKGDAAKIPVVFALGEPPDPDKTADQEKDLGFCLVGGFYVDHPGGSVRHGVARQRDLEHPQGVSACRQEQAQGQPDRADRS